MYARPRIYVRHLVPRFAEPRNWYAIAVELNGDHLRFVVGDLANTAASHHRRVLHVRPELMQNLTGRSDAPMKLIRIFMEDLAEEHMRPQDCLVNLCKAVRA